ncbi:hypothetical protein GGI03_002535, partial [Coemansia sp. RSA 2337]
MFEDMFPVVSGNNEIYTIDDTAEYFGTKLADDYHDAISSEHGESAEVYADAMVIASAKRYSILSVIFSDVDCFSMVSLEFSTDGDSSHALESNVYLEGQDSDIVTKNVTNNHSVTKSIADGCSVASIDSKRSEAMAIADEAKAFFSGLSERDRSTLSISLCMVIEESVGKAVPRVEYVKVNCVVRMALRFRARGEMNVTPEVLLMAAGINMLGVDNALGWLYPIIEEFCLFEIQRRAFRVDVNRTTISVPKRQESPVIIDWELRRCLQRNDTYLQAKVAAATEKGFKAIESVMHERQDWVAAMIKAQLSCPGSYWNTFHEDILVPLPSDAKLAFLANDWDEYIAPAVAYSGLLKACSALSLQRRPFIFFPVVEHDRMNFSLGEGSSTVLFALDE